jgi:hypothetical protein
MVVNLRLNYTQAFAYRSDSQASFGYLTAIHFGSGNTTLSADLQATNPIMGTQVSSTAVAILESFQWAGGSTDTLTLDGYVSGPNRDLLSRLVHGPMTDLSVTLSFVIYEFNQVSGRWFRPIYLEGAPLNAMVHKTGAIPQIGIDTTTPVNPVPNSGWLGYKFTVEVDPLLLSSPVQTITTATSPQAKDQTQQSWGTPRPPSPPVQTGHGSPGDTPHAKRA